jgi:hypothetical protein
MTRRRRTANGIIELLSWSYFGVGDAEAALRAEVLAIEELYRKTRQEDDKNDDDPIRGRREN